MDDFEVAKARAAERGRGEAYHSMAAAALSAGDAKLYASLCNAHGIKPVNLELYGRGCADLGKKTFRLERRVEHVVTGRVPVAPVKLDSEGQRWKGIGNAVRSFRVGLGEHVSAGEYKLRFRQLEEAGYDGLPSNWRSMSAEDIRLAYASVKDAVRNKMTELGVWED